MPEFREHAPGTFCWIELMTTDSAAAKQFYCDLFGWSFHDDPVGDDAVYTVLSMGDRFVGALYERSREQAAQGVPPHWGSYISVADANATTAKVIELGGAAVMEPFDVFDIGRMAVLRDSTGAFFSIWQAKKHIGAQLKGEPVSLCWNELLTRDPGAAEKFYTALFGWNASTDMSDTPYTMFSNQDQPTAGMMAIATEMGEVPSCWLPYFAVADCDQTAEKSRKLGGRLEVPSTDIPEVGQFAVVSDPQGAVFGVIQLNQG